MNFASLEFHSLAFDEFYSPLLVFFKEIVMIESTRTLASREKNQLKYVN